MLLSKSSIELFRAMSESHCCCSDRDAFAEWVFSQPDALLTDAIELVSLEVDEEGRGFGCLKYLTRQTAEQVQLRLCCLLLHRPVYRTSERTGQASRLRYNP